MISKYAIKAQIILGYLLFFVFSNATLASSEAKADFSEGTKIKIGEPRDNIYGLSQDEFEKSKNDGRLNVLVYPVTSTGLQLPYNYLDRVLNQKVKNPQGIIINPVSKIFSPWKDFEGLYSWLGLSKYPALDTKKNTPYELPKRELLDADYLGATLLGEGSDKALTFSCAACHVGSLFGKPVVGLTNRRPNAFEFVHLGVQMRQFLRPNFSRLMGPLSKDELEMMKKTFNSTRYIRAKSPVHESLDTSLAIVGLSLSKRAEDEYASREPKNARRPRPNPLNYHPVDSKPSVWWNLKYKNRWLSDGSVVSGNPIFTNILWNEIGRGSDLKELEKWLDDNSKIVEDMTSFVFSTEAPRYTDFFENVDLEKAEAGRQLFDNNCARCHGSYEKKWQAVDKTDWHVHGTEYLTQTTKVSYHERTPVIDVGTDSNRYEGIKYFADDLNRLKLSKKFGTKVVPQKGYVPPPLVGIWARWPYFHNNSVASLCEVLTSAKKRRIAYYAVPAENKDTDFDQNCVGYPSNFDLVKRPDAIKFDTSKKALGNMGHDEGIITKDGEEIYTAQEKMQIIEFLKTL